MARTMTRAKANATTMITSVCMRLHLGLATLLRRADQFQTCSPLADLAPRSEVFPSDLNQTLGASVSFTGVAPCFAQIELKFKCVTVTPVP